MRISDWSSDVCSSDLTARGNRVGLEGSAENVALARDVLSDLYKRIQRGEEIDTGLVDTAIAMASEPELDGIVRAEAGDRAPTIMIRTRKKTIVPRTPMQAHYMRELVGNDMNFALGDRQRTRHNSSHSCASRMP